MVKNPPANAGDARDVSSVPMWGRSLEKEMAVHSRILAWEIPWTEESGSYSPWGCKRVGHDLATKQQQSRYQMSLLLQVRSNSMTKTGTLRLKRKMVIYILGKFYPAVSIEIHSALKLGILGIKNQFLLFVFFCYSPQGSL